MLDIGGGLGIYSFFASAMGAKHVVCLEPEEKGSAESTIEKFKKLSDALSLDNVQLQTCTFQEYEPNQTFDIILLHNSINHIDEESCINLLNSYNAKKTYQSIFEKLYVLSNKNVKLIICDCSRYNFFASMGIKNPIARSIQWNKHQSPYTWSRMLQHAGFKEINIKWSSFNSLRSYGRLLLGNRIAAFFLYSHFCLTMEKD